MQCGPFECTHATVARHTRARHLILRSFLCPRARLEPTEWLTLAVALIGVACTSESPTAPAALTAAADRSASHLATGPRTDLNVELNGAGEAEGSIRFRQPNDGLIQISLDTRIEGLAPDHDYYLQRAALVMGNGCVDGGWLTLGLGTVVTPIHTDGEGEGHAMLFRNLPATLVGTAFDIHFQIIDATTSAVVMQSRCYQYIVSGT